MRTLLSRLRTFAIGGAVALTGMASVTATSARAEEEVNLATVAWIGYAPFYVAAEKNMFEKYGVKVALKDFADPALIPAALQSGGIQGAMYTYDQVINLVANGNAYRVVMPIDYSNGADALVAEKSIKSLADLKGKKVAYPFATCDNLLVAFALQQAGLTEADVEGLDTTPENVAAALMGGAVAGATYEPNVSKILKLDANGGYHALYTSASAPGLITDILYFSTDYIEKKPKAVEGVIKGYIDGMAFLKEHPDEAYTIVAKYFSTTVDDVKEQAKGAYNIPVAEMAGYFAPRDDAKSLFTSGKLIADVLIKRGQIKSAPKIEDTYEAKFVSSLIAAK
ncbi:ABC transporter substrate-binding protein [Hyphomicrobium sp. 99]|uniref:ABC transporter substrate-binding protein n=1 Tax=Hyphomicrobium sp. 99 TaxID=1163419 RepID=UPI0005F79508|nr:ABC transporter substrate-binding protein [Hyphomicrobium sp. 99]